MPSSAAADPFAEVDLAHPLTAHRIPVLRNPYPRWCYHVALVVTDPHDGDSPWSGVGLDPTPREAAQLIAYLEFRLRFYRDSYRAQMAAAYPFDVDGSVNTYTFRKEVEVGWQYHATTWTRHVWFPQAGLHAARYDSLSALLDKINTIGSGEPTAKWQAFKAEVGLFD